METRQWWFKIETYHGNVPVLFSQHTMCKDIMNGAVVNYFIYGSRCIVEG